MSFENSQPQQESEKDKIKQKCQELDLKIQGLIEVSKKLEQYGWKLRSLEYAQQSLSETQKDLGDSQRKLTGWPKGILGLKDKKGYEDLALKIEKLKKELETRQQALGQSQSDLGEYGESKPLQQIEQEKQSLQAQLRQQRLERRKTGIKLFEKSGDTSLGTALEMYGDLFFGPEEVNRVFGLDLKPEDIPPLPPKDKLEKAKDLNDVILALKVREDQNPEWELFPNKIVAETSFRNYIEETKGIREFLKKHDLISQEELDETTDEELSKLAELIKTDEVGTFEQLVSMKINQNRRHSFEDMVYFVRLIRGQADDMKYTRDSNSTPGFKRQEVLDDSFESTKSFTKDERGVWVKSIGKFTDPRAGGYIKETKKPSSKETAGWGTNYATGVRIRL